MMPTGPVIDGKKSLLKQPGEKTEPAFPEPEVSIFPDLKELKSRRDATMKMIKKFGWFGK